MRLYEINAAMRSAIERAKWECDETGEIPEWVASELDAIECARETKILDVAAVIKELTAEAKAHEEEGKKQLAIARARTNAALRLKEYLLSNVTEGEKVKDARASISWRSSEAVVVDDEDSLPENCFRVVREVSKTAVREMIEAGEIDTAAHIEKRQNIQIR